MSLIDRRFRLADEAGDLGLNCTSEGVFLAGAPLLRKTAAGLAPRPDDEIGALMKGAYGRHIDPAGLSTGLNLIAEALNRGDLGRAMIAALHLRLPDLNWDGAAGIARADEALAKYDPSEPRDRRGRWTTGDKTDPDDAPKPVRGQAGQGQACMPLPSPERLSAVDDRALDPNRYYTNEQLADHGLFPGTALDPAGPHPSPSLPSGPLIDPFTGKPLDSPQALNSNGYIPRAEDLKTFTRMLFAEGADTPEDYSAIGWAILNRVGRSEFGATLNAVLNQRNGFQIVEAGGSPAGNSRQWNLSANPAVLTGANLAAWNNAVTVAIGIFSGAIPDPTGGATFFFASSKYDGTPESAPHWYATMLKEGKLRPSPYLSQSALSVKNYFFCRNKK